MTEEIKVYLDLSHEIQKSLTQKELTIKDVLRRANIEGKVDLGVIPSQSEDDNKSKGLTPFIILAVAFAVKPDAIASAISKVIESLQGIEVEVEINFRDDVYIIRFNGSKK